MSRIISWNSIRPLWKGTFWLNHGRPLIVAYLVGFREALSIQWKSIDVYRESLDKRWMASGWRVGIPQRRASRDDEWSGPSGSFQFASVQCVFQEQMGNGIKKQSSSFCGTPIWLRYHEIQNDQEQGLIDSYCYQETEQAVPLKDRQRTPPPTPHLPHRC